MEAIVLGAGMVGVSTALALQEAGHDVTLIDKGDPGREASYGNGGIIQTEVAEPYAFPRKPSAIISAIVGKSNDVKWDWRALPAYAMPIASYFLNSAPKSHARISRAYAALTSSSTRDHTPLIKAAKAEALIRRDGYHAVFRSAKKLDEASLVAERLSKTYGVRNEILSGSQFKEREPGLISALQGAIHWKDPWTCADPGLLTEKYAELFVSRGGWFVHGDALTLQERRSECWRVSTDDGHVEGAIVVVALGAWTPILLRRLGYRIHLFNKRGYHRHYAVADGPNRPVLDSEKGALCAPMARGLRICTGAHLAHSPAPGIPVQLRRAESAISELFRLGDPVESKPWTGNRPCMPDMLPIVGKAPNHGGLWFNFGHGHQGFTMGPTTGRLLAEQIADRRPRSELTSYLSFERLWGQQ